MRSAKVVPRGCSRPLQRAIVDFAADQSFALARMKLLEHYGFEIGESTIQRVALGHAKTVFEAGGVSQDFPQTVGRHTEIVAQTDGGMIPIVEPDASQKDKRKGKTLSWREANLGLSPRQRLTFTLVLPTGIRFHDRDHAAVRLSDDLLVATRRLRKILRRPAGFEQGLGMAKSDTLDRALADLNAVVLKQFEPRQSERLIGGKVGDRALKRP